jgi:hypothetical protein
MLIKSRFELNQADNLLNLSRAQINTLVTETNTPKHVYAALELKKTSIKHNLKDRVLDYVKNVKSTKDLEIILHESYPLSVSYNKKTHSKIVNIAPFNSKEVGRVSHTKLYAAILYAYTFEKIITGKLKIPDTMAQPISNYWFSLFVQVFGRDYGMTGTYSSKLPGLKFMLTVYILVAFFGKKQDKSAYNLAKKYSGYQYEDQIAILNQYDLTSILDLVRVLSATSIMPGFNIIKFTTKAHNMFGVQMLPMFEDLSRFLSTIMTSSVGGQDLAKPFIHKYNRAVYMILLNYMEKKLF